MSSGSPSLHDIDTTTPTLALVGGTLVDGTGAEPVADSVVLIDGEVISCAGSRDQCEVPDSAHTVRTEGQWLTPGLVDGHVHFSQTGWVDARSDQINVRSQYPYEQVMSDNYNNPEHYYRAYLCSGVTAVYDVGGFPWSWSLRKPAEHNPLAPHIAATGPLVSNYVIEFANVLAEKQFLTLDSAETADQIVQYMVANNSDAIKLYYLPDSPEELEAFHLNIRHLTGLAKRAGIPVVAHAQEHDAAKFVIEAGVSMLVHSVGDKLVDGDFVDLAKSKGIAYAPTLTVHDGYTALRKAVEDKSEPLIDDPNGCVDRETLAKIRSSKSLGQFVNKHSRLFMSVDEPAQKEIMAANLKRLHNAGVIVVTSTDAGNPLTLAGPSIYSERERMQEAGLSPMEVLVASTKNGAIAMGRKDDFGTIEAGKIADILLVTADPTQDIRNMRQLESVIRAGHLHRQRDLRAK